MTDLNLTKFTRLDTEFCVSLDEAKSHLRIFETDEDVQVQFLINAACEYIELYTHRRLQRSIYNLSGSVKTEDKVYLPYGVTTITEIKGTPYQEAERPLQVNIDYKMIGDDVVVFLAPFEGLSIDVECGYPFDRVPKILTYAVLMMLGTLYECKQDISYGIQAYQMPFTTKNLMAPFINWIKV